MKDKLIKQNIVVYLIVVFLLFFMTIGYASYEEELVVDTTATLAKDPILDLSLKTDYAYEIYRVDEGVIINVDIKDCGDSSLKISIVNDSDMMFTYAGNSAVSDNKMYPCIKGILPGDYVLPHSVKEITIMDLEGMSLGNITLDLQLLDNAVMVNKPYILTNISSLEIEIGKEVEVSILNQYDTSIEVEFYLNDNDLGVSIVNDKVILDKGESKTIPLVLEGNILDSTKTMLYARVKSMTNNDDVYLIGNINVY